MSSYGRDGSTGFGIRRVTTNRLSLTNALEAAKIERAAERIASEIFDAIHGNVATKADLAALKADLERQVASEGNRLAALIFIVAALLFGALHLWPPHP